MQKAITKDERVRQIEAAAGELVGRDRAALVGWTRDRSNRPDAAVLALAYHRLWAAGRREEADAVAARLLAGVPGRGEYMGWLFRVCITRVSEKTFWRDAEDLYQGALIQIFRTLQTPRGARAHTAWRPFCFDRLYDAIRERTRRDLPTEDLDAPHPDTGDVQEPLEMGRRQQWHGTAEPDHLPALISHLQRAAEAIEDPRVRLVALDQFFDDPSPIDRLDPSRPDKRPLTEVLGTDRFSVNRLKLKARELLEPARREWLDGDTRPAAPVS